MPRQETQGNTTAMQSALKDKDDITKQYKVAVSAHLAAPSIHHKDIQCESVHGVECMRLADVEIKIALQRHSCLCLGSSMLLSACMVAGGQAWQEMTQCWDTGRGSLETPYDSCGLVESR